MRKGGVAAFSGFVFWGLLPIYWKWLDQVPAFEILCHRIVWSMAFVLILLLLQKRLGWISATIRQPRVVLMFLISATLLGANWFVYIWAVTSGYILESSLGYFMTPLVNVLLGVIFLRERPRLWQWTAIGLAACGVIYLTITYGRPPYISLFLAINFGVYGLMRKTATLGSLEGLTLETGLLFFPAFLYLLQQELAGLAAFGHADWRTNVLLALSGVVTASPLLLFAYGARRIMLTTLGLMQYMAPTISFCLGVFVYHEPFNIVRLIGFGFIWAALAIYTVDGFRHYRRILLAERLRPGAEG